MKKLIFLLMLCFITGNVLAQNIISDRAAPTTFYNDYVKPANFIFEATITKIEIVTENERFYRKCFLKVHKSFKGNLPSFNLIYKSEIDSGDRAYYQKYQNKDKKINNFTYEGVTSLWLIYKISKVGLEFQFSDDYNINAIQYFLNFDTYTYKDKEMLVKNELKYGNSSRDTTEVEMPYGFKSLKKVSDLYDTLFRYPEIKLSYNDGSVFRQMTAKEWLDAHPGMRPNWKNIIEPIPPVEVYKPTDTEVLKQNEEDLKKAIEFHKKMSKPLGPKEKRKLLKQQKKNNATLSYFIKNEYYTVITGGNTYLEFDVVVNSSITTYLTAGGAVLNFNQNMFGNYADVLSNIQATVSPTFNTYDVGIYVSPNGAVFDMYNTDLVLFGVNNIQVLANIEYPVFHVKMKLLNSTAGTTNITFNTAQMNSSSLSQYANSPTQTMWLDYNASSTDVEDHIPLKPVINNVSSPSTTFKGGTGEIVTIDGKFFGDEGLIRFFNDADTKVGLMNLNFNDVVSWNNNQIKIKIPSVVDFIGQTVNQNDPTPGTGTFAVVSDINQISLPRSIVIDYSIFTSDQGTKPRYNEVGYTISNTPDKKLKFNVDKEVFDNPEAMKCIRAAMRQWSCATGINMVLGTITTSTANPKYNNSDGITTIYFEVENDPLKANTLISTYISPCTTGQFYNGQDIKIRSNRPWNYSIAGPILNTENHFYSAILHEFGHVSNLDHTLNADMMFPSIPPGVIKTTLSQNDIDGGNDVMTASLAYNPASACSAFTITAANKTAIGCYATSSQKMQLEGISISCKCAPSFSIPATLPILQPRINGGVPPYYYYWEALTGNSATINNNYAEQPTVTACSLVNNTRKVKYKLTVIDNAAEPTVTSRIIEVDLTISQTVNYAMRDSYEDVYDEPNNQVHWDIWNSPDIWNRKTSGTSNTEHENPEYFAAAPNYVNFRIRNVGCITPPINKHAIRLYWTKSSTGEDWDQDWKTANSSNGKPEGREITTGNGFVLSNTNQLIAPGQEKVFSLPWNPPLPQDSQNLVHLLFKLMYVSLQELNQKI